MIKNYFRTAIRNMLGNKVFSFINIAGLSLGLSCCLLILLYTKDELSYDRFHVNKERIFQLTCDRIEKEGTHEKFAIAAMVQGPAFSSSIPGIRSFVRVNNKQLVVKIGADTFNEEVTWADENFFTVFSFPLLNGNSQNVLSTLQSVVLTDVTAEKYFGSRNAVGKTLEISINGKFEPFVVSGIAKKAPENSSIKFNLLLPFKYLESAEPDNGWMWVSYPTYFVVEPNSDLRAIQVKMQQVFELQAKSEIDINHQAGYDNKFVWGLQPITKMHLDTAYKGVPEASDPIYSYILAAITIFILLIACINFINLSMAQSLHRSKEIGIRKVIGGSGRQLLGQFFGESVLACGISFLLAILITLAILPTFNTLADKKLSPGYLFDFQLLAGIIFLFIATVFAAGFYPAMVLAGFKPVQALQAKNKYGSKNYLAKSLIILQFGLTTLLIISTLFIYAQFNYITTADLGYNYKNLVEFNIDKAIMNKPLMELYKTTLSAIPGVQSIGYINVGKFGGKTLAGGKEFLAVYQHVDENYLSTLQAPVLSGRNFEKNFPSDSISSVLVNEAFAKAAGWKDPIGKTVDFMNLPGWGTRKITVIGLVKDYHFESLKEKIKPQLFTMVPELPLGHFVARVNSNNEQATMLSIEKAFHVLIPDHPFEYSFTEDLLYKNYKAESKWKGIISFAAFITIFISCIGLFGLTMLSTQRRIKEIGIRKVLGASATEVLQLISRDFMKLVFIAFLFAIPLSWFLINRWLQNFAYRIAVSWWIFALAGCLVMLIALVTICIHAFSAARLNPAISLRTE